jgi:hypothetical protein
LPVSGCVFFAGAAVSNNRGYSALNIPQNVALPPCHE